MKKAKAPRIEEQDKGAVEESKPKPGIVPPGRKLTRDEAMDRLFEKNEELYRRLAIRNIAN